MGIARAHWLGVVQTVASVLVGCLVVIMVLAGSTSASAATTVTTSCVDGAGRVWHTRVVWGGTYPRCSRSSTRHAERCWLDDERKADAHGLDGAGVRAERRSSAKHWSRPRRSITKTARPGISAILGIRQADLAAQ